MSSPIPKPTCSQHRRPLSSIFLLTLSLPLLTIASAASISAQAPQPPTPDVVARVTAARKIFLSNAGANDSFLHDIPNGATAAYNQLYAALQQWGRFQLVDTPAQADLIFQIRGTEVHPVLEDTFSGNIIPHQHPPLLDLAILDPQTLTLLDTLSVRAGRADNIPKGNIAFAQSIEYLTYQIGTLVSAPPRTSSELHPNSTQRPSFEALLTAVAPVPPQVLNAKTVFVKTDAPPNDPYLKRFTAGLAAWGYYHLVNSPEHADAVFTLHDTEADGISVSIHAPNSKAILWTLCDPHYGFYRQGGEKRVAALTQNLISTLKQLNQIPLTPAETSALR